MDNNELMEALKSESLNLKANICKPEVNLVWGEGNVNSPLVIVGEAPGEQENHLMRPFVGAAGTMLNSELSRAGIQREQIYITNAVKCRPIQVSSGKVINRTPTVKETQDWHEILLKEIEIVSPQIILCLGAVAGSVLIHQKFTMTKDRGKWFDGPLDTQILATYHPAYLLRVKQYGDKKALFQFRTDLNTVVERLSEYNRMRAAS